MYWKAPRTPLSGQVVKDTCDRCAAVTAAALVVFDCHIPDRKLVPVAADQGVTTVVAVCTRAFEVVDVACVDVVESVL